MPKMLAMTKAIAIFEKRLKSSLSTCFDNNDPDALSKTLENEINRLLKKTWDVIQQNRAQSSDDDNADLQWQPLAAAFRDCMLHTLDFYFIRARNDNNRPIKPEMILTVVNCQRKFTGILSNLNSIYSDNEQAAVLKSKVSTTKKSLGGIFTVRASSASSNSSEVGEQTGLSLTQQQLLPYIMPWPQDAKSCDYRKTKTETLVEMTKSVIMDYARADEQRSLAYLMLNELNSRADYTIPQHIALCLCMQRNDGVITLEQDNIELANTKNNDDDDMPTVGATTYNVALEEAAREMQHDDYMKYSIHLLNVMRFSIAQCFPTAVDKRYLIRAHLHEYCYWNNVTHHPLYACFKALDDTQRAELLLQFVADCRDTLPTTGKLDATISKLPQIQDAGTSNLSQVTLDNASQLFATLIGQFNLARLAKPNNSNQQDHPQYFLQNDHVMIGKLLNTLGGLPTIGKQVVHYYISYLCELVRQVDTSWNTSPVQLASVLSEIKNCAVQEAIITAYFDISDEADETVSFKKRFHPDVVEVFFTTYGQTLQRMSIAAMKMSKQEQENLRLFRRQLFVSCTGVNGMSLEKLRALFVQEHRFLLEEMVMYIGGPDPWKFRRDDELKWQCVRLNLNTELSCELLTSMQLTLTQIETCLSEHIDSNALQTALLEQLDRHFNLIYPKMSTKQEDKLAVADQQRKLVWFFENHQNRTKLFDRLLQRYAAAVKSLTEDRQDMLLLLLCNSHCLEQAIALLADYYMIPKNLAATKQRFMGLLIELDMISLPGTVADEKQVSSNATLSNASLGSATVDSKQFVPELRKLQNYPDFLQSLVANKKFCQGLLFNKADVKYATFLVHVAIVSHCPSQFVELIVLPSLLAQTDMTAVAKLIKLLIQHAPSSMAVSKMIYTDKKLNALVDVADLEITLMHTLAATTEPQQSKISANTGADSDESLKCQLLANHDFMGRLPYVELCNMAANEKITSQPVLQRLMQTLLEIAYNNPQRLDKDSVKPDSITDALEALFNRQHSPRIHLLRALCLQCAFDAQNTKILFSSLSLKQSHASRVDYYQTIAFIHLDRTQLSSVGKYLPAKLLPLMLEKFAHDDAAFFATQMLSLFMLHPSDLTELIISKTDPFMLNQQIFIELAKVDSGGDVGLANKLKRLRRQLVVNEILLRQRVDSVKDYTDSRISLLDYVGNITAEKHEKTSVLKIAAKDLNLLALIASQAPLIPDVFTDLLLAHPNMPTEITEKLWPASMDDALIDQLVLKLMKQHGDKLQQYDSNFKTLLAHYSFAKNIKPLSVLEAFNQRLEVATCTYTESDKQRLRLFVYHTTWVTQQARKLLNYLDTKTYEYYLMLDTRLFQECKRRVALSDHSYFPKYVLVNKDHCYVDSTWAEAWESREEVIKNARRRARLEDSALLLPEQAFHGLYEDGNVKVVLNEQDIDALKLFESARVLEVMVFMNDDDNTATHTMS